MGEFIPLNLAGSGEAEKANEEKSLSGSTANKASADEVFEAEQKAEAEDSADENALTEETEKSEVKETCGETAGGKADEAVPQPDKLDKIIEAQQQLSESIDALHVLFNERIMHTDHEEKIADRMHNELQKYKEDMYTQLVRPILLDMINVRDSIMRMADKYLAKPEGEQSIPNQMFSGYASELKDILEKYFVEIYKSEPGDNYIPVRHRAVKRIAADDESLHGKIAESLSCGYSCNGKVISSEKITVYYYEKNGRKNDNKEVTENV